MLLISASQRGNEIGERLKGLFDDLEIITREEVVKYGLKDVTKKAVKNHKTIIFVSSTGIAVRAIAPWVEDKAKDPAVIVIDREARYVISLLSGHIGGANETTNKIANYLGSAAIITTATDSLGVMAPDLISKKYNLEIESMQSCKEIAVRLIEGEKIAFIDEDNIIPLPSGYVKEGQGANYNLVVTNRSHVPAADLKLIRKNIVLGIGCRKNIESDTMSAFILASLKKLNINLLAINKIVSIDIKKDEKCIIDLASYLKVPLKVYSREEINQVKVDFEGSDFVEENVGVRGVSEPCVLLADAQIIQGKIAYSGMTLCVGKL